MRVSITEPGHEHKETIKSASKSAASGGITSIICNTSPPIDQPAIIHSIQRRARKVIIKFFVLDALPETLKVMKFVSFTSCKNQEQ